MICFPPLVNAVASNTSGVFPFFALNFKRTVVPGRLISELRFRALSKVELLSIVYVLENSQVLQVRKVVVRQFWHGMF